MSTGALTASLWSLYSMNSWATEQFLWDGKAVKCKTVNAEADPDAMKGLNVKGYPSFLLNSQGKLIEFNGERNADGFMSFLKQNLA